VFARKTIRLLTTARLLPAYFPACIVHLCHLRKRKQFNREKVAAVKNAVDVLLLLKWLEEQSAQQERLDPHQQAWMHRMDFGRHITLVMRQQIAQGHQRIG